MQGQLTPDEGFMDGAQPGDGDRADIDARPSRHRIGHVDRMLRRILQGGGHGDLGEGIALIEKGRLQPGAGGQNIARAGGLSAFPTRRLRGQRPALCP